MNESSDAQKRPRHAVHDHGAGPQCVLCDLLDTEPADKDAGNEIRIA
jgi:hypothetical protein